MWLNIELKFNQQIIMIIILTIGPLINIIFRENESFKFSLVNNFIASEIGCRYPIMDTFIGPFR